MASWSAILALSGFHYSAVSGVLTFGSVSGTDFWSTGDAWGTVRIDAENEVTLEVMGGEITFSQLIVKGIVNKKLRKPVTLKQGDKMKF